MTDEAQLLRRYAETGAEEAFTEVVRRNLDFVYATAHRHLADGHLAQDVAQTVFIDLARKASALSRHPALVSWLYTSTRFAALKAIRSTQRRQAREKQAHLMQQTEASDPPIQWEQLRPLLDEALQQLDETHRAAILLRYFRGLPFAEVATTLAINEGAARTRVSRALHKLSQLLAQRGIRSTSAALGLALGSQPLLAAPAGLVATLSGTAVAAALTAGPVGLGLFESLLLMNKLKLAAVGVLALAGLATAVIEVRANRALNAELRAVTPAEVTQLQTENRELRAAVAKLSTGNPDLGELTRLRARIATLKARPPGVTDAELHPMRNLGRATPAAAMETFVWAMINEDLDLAASYLVFSDDTPENRAAFMANFSEAVRARYRTPERLCAQAFFNLGFKNGGDIPEALQIVKTKAAESPTQIKVQAWLRLVSGKEIPLETIYQFREDGWTNKAIALLSPAHLPIVRARINPITGDPILPPVPLATAKP